jgi:hypothetical protein
VAILDRALTRIVKLLVEIIDLVNWKTNVQIVHKLFKLLRINLTISVFVNLSKKLIKVPKGAFVLHQLFIDNQFYQVVHSMRLETFKLRYQCFGSLVIKKAQKYFLSCFYSELVDNRLTDTKIFQLLTAILYYCLYLYL